MFRKKNKSIIMSYMSLRQFIGILGMLLPFICIIGGFAFSGLSVQQSISYYYHTNMRDFFVGLLIGVSFFLITYKGYQLIDDIVTTSSGVAGFGIAVFPCLYSSSCVQPVGIFQLAPKLSNTIHLACASTFFILLAVNSLFLFTLSKSEEAAKTGNKRKRNLVYRICGALILVSLITLIIVLLTVNHEKVEQLKLVLIFEAVMLIAFGISWLVKGEAILKDIPLSSQ